MKSAGERDGLGQHGRMLPTHIMLSSRHGSTKQSLKMLLFMGPGCVSRTVLLMEITYLLNTVGEGR